MNRKNERHGLSDTSEYVAWSCMIDRCINPINKRFKDYGARGVSVCAQWRTSFLSFLSHVGQKSSPEMSIDRINNDGNYEPGNVKWSPPITQAANRRTNRTLTIDGKTLTLSQWSREKGINRNTLQRRVDKGWPTDKLFTAQFEFKEPLLEARRRQVAARTHCKYGHEFTLENTSMHDGARHCIACRQIHNREYSKTRVRDQRKRKAA